MTIGFYPRCSGVIVSPHGAGLMNLIFAPPFSAVVEVYPYHTHHNLYPGLAAMMGIAHYPVHTFNGSSILSVEQVCSSTVTTVTSSSTVVLALFAHFQSFSNSRIVQPDSENYIVLSSFRARAYVRNSYCYYHGCFSSCDSVVQND